MDVKELTANLADRVWRLNNLYWIIDKRKQRVKFRLNSAQERLCRELHTRNVALKARQKGITTFWCIFALDSCLFNSNFAAGIIAHNLDDSSEIFRTKIKFPYDNLPESIRKAQPADTDRAGMLVFGNGSRIRVATSFRSGTLNLLHVSELGKIAARYPDRAREIKTGAIEAVPVDGTVSIESTAEGAFGMFYEICKEAEAVQMSGRSLTPLDYRFHFFPWHLDNEYELDPRDVVVTREHQDYFDELAEKHGITLNERQRAWYVAKKRSLGDDMLREYPSTPEEAFRASVEGAYFASEFRSIRKERRIGRVQIEAGTPVNTAWDLGLDDYTSIVFYQNVGREVRVVDYYSSNGVGLEHYVKVIRDKGYLLGNHYFPHDIEVKELSSGKSRRESIEGMGLRVTVAPKLGVADGIEAARKLLSICWFDETRCSKLIEHLESYRREWDDRLAVFREKPVHDIHSHAADAFRYMAVTHQFDTPMGYFEHYDYDSPGRVII